MHMITHALPPLLATQHIRTSCLLSSEASDCAFIVKDYHREASELFNNMRAPASLLAGALIGATFSLNTLPTDAILTALVKRLHMLVGLVSVSSELLAVVACTVAINKLSEVRVPETAGVQKLLVADDRFELAWLAANFNFFIGLIGLVVMTGARAWLAFGTAGRQWALASAFSAASTALLMASLVNTAIATGDGSKRGPTAFGKSRSLLGLGVRFAALLGKRAKSAPLTAASLACALAATGCAAAGMLVSVTVVR